MALAIGAADAHDAGPSSLRVPPDAQDVRDAALVVAGGASDAYDAHLVNQMLMILGHSGSYYFRIHIWVPCLLKHARFLKSRLLAENPALVHQRSHIPCYYQTITVFLERFQ